mmetsp:Transcript_4569/g.6497  ORF Transcript_4569/g.6497 Transcript_4569/m.6497 type:complete len:266 (+) Transcript_4569:464-1261(+)
MPFSETWIIIFPTVAVSKLSNCCQTISVRPSPARTAYTGRAPIRIPASSYVRNTAGAHLVAIQSARRSTSGTEENDASNNCAPAPDESIFSTRPNSSSHVSSGTSFLPLCDERNTSSPSAAETDPRAMRAAASPTERRDVRELLLFRVLPETESVGSTRTERIEYSSQRTGSRRGPPMRGEKSGDDSGTPNSSPWRSFTTLEASAAIAPSRLAGISTFLPPNREPNKPPSLVSSAASSVSAGRIASFLPRTDRPASFAATLIESM